MYCIKSMMIFVKYIVSFLYNMYNVHIWVKRTQYRREPNFEYRTEYHTDLLSEPIAKIEGNVYVRV